MSVVDRLKRAREPLAWAVTALCAGFVVVLLANVVWTLAHDHATLFEAARRFSGSTLNVGPLVLLVAVVLSCRLLDPPTPRAALISRIATWVVAVAAGIDLVLALLATVKAPGSWFGVGLGLLGDLLAIGVKVIAVVVLRVVGRVEATGSPDTGGRPEDEGGGRPVPDPGSDPGRGDDDSGRGVDDSGRGDEGAGSPPSSAAEAGGSSAAPVWAGDGTVGASWTRAGDAASGAAASSWGESGAWTAGSADREPSPQLDRGPRTGWDELTPPGRDGAGGREGRDTPTH